MVVKKLIINCDGTWMNADNGVDEDGNGPQIPSNVSRIGHAIKAEDSQGVQQIVFYQAGVGSGPSLADRYLSGAVGRGLKENVCAAYGFLANNYDYGDEIYITGFSRGAFTARCVSGLVGKVGILTKLGMEDFYDIFEDFEHERITTEQVEALEQNQRTWLKYTDDQTRKETKISIKAVGVWDTVGALGIPWRGSTFFKTPSWVKQYSFWDTTLGNHIEHAFHAMSLNERRDLYVPTLWENPDPDNITTTLEQVWFSGDHAGVGGGWPDSGTADITLAWMMSQLAPLGLEFKDDYIPRQFNRAMQYFESNHLDRRNWGLGLINDMTAGVTSLFHWTGTIDRHPGSYREKDPETGVDSDTYLKNTSEQIHPSVRFRKSVQNNDPRSLLGALDSSAFNPKGLIDYQMKGTTAEDTIKWVPIKNQDAQILAESDLGKYEKILLGLYDREFPGTWKKVMGNEMPSNIDLPGDTS